MELSKQHKEALRQTFTGFSLEFTDDEVIIHQGDQEIKRIKNKDVEQFLDSGFKMDGS